MPVQQTGVDNTTVLDVDSGHKAGRMSLRPSDVIGWSSIPFKTGILPAATVAGALLLVLRNTGSNLLLVRRLQVGFNIVTAFATAQRLEFSLTRASTWTSAFESTGNPVNFATGKHKSSLANIAAEGRVATTAALTAATRTVEGQALAIAGGGVGGLGTSIAPQNLISHDAGDYPVVLANGEGLLLTSDVVFGAGGSGIAYGGIEVAEMAAGKWA